MLIVSIVKINYGMKDKDPVRSAIFYDQETGEDGGAFHSAMVQMQASLWLMLSIKLPLSLSLGSGSGSDSTWMLLHLFPIRMTR